MDELTQALYHIKNRIEHQISDVGQHPPLSDAEYSKLLESQLSDVEKAIELSLAAIQLRNNIGSGD